MCDKLQEFLKHKIAFDVAGGCGVDLSLGQSPCMANSGVWFKYCPFCGAEIVAAYHPAKYYWTWKERDPQDKQSILFRKFK